MVGKSPLYPISYVFSMGLRTSLREQHGSCCGTFTESWTPRWQRRMTNDSDRSGGGQGGQPLGFLSWSFTWFYRFIPIIYIYFLVVPCCTTSSHSSSVAWLLIWPFETIQLMPVDGAPAPAGEHHQFPSMINDPDPFKGPFCWWSSHIVCPDLGNLNCNQKMRKRIRSTRWALDFVTEFGGLHIFRHPRWKHQFGLPCSISIYHLVGGLEHGWNIFPYWEFHDPNWRTHIFQRGRYTTNQSYISLYPHNML